MVTAHLVLQVAPDTPLVYMIDDPCANPLSHLVRNDFLRRFAPVAEYWEHRITDFRSGVRRVERRFGRRHLTGIRAEESSGRAISAKVYGASSPNACRPIIRWSAADVFAYLARHDLPVHPGYAMLGGGRYERAKIRVDQLGERVDGVASTGWCDGGFNSGRDEWEREYFGDVLRRIEAGQLPQA